MRNAMEWMKHNTCPRGYHFCSFILVIVVVWKFIGVQGPGHRIPATFYKNQINEQPWDRGNITPILCVINLCPSFLNDVRFIKKYWYNIYVKNMLCWMCGRILIRVHFINSIYKMHWVRLVDCVLIQGLNIKNTIY